MRIFGYCGYSIIAGIRLLRIAQFSWKQPAAQKIKALKIRLVSLFPYLGFFKLFETIIDANSLANLILNNVSIPIKIGNLELSIPIEELRMKKEQFYKIQRQGLSRIKQNIYDVSDKADIIVKLILQ